MAFLAGPLADGRYEIRAGDAFRKRGVGELGRPDQRHAVGEHHRGLIHGFAKT